MHWTIEKIGQYPAWSVEPPRDLKKVLAEYEPLYKKGTICESQGYGIGAFAYYRRIVEDIIDKLLENIGELLSEDEKAKYENELSKVQDTIVAAKKIAVVKDLLPLSLRPNNENPLSLMHETLSVGLHELSEAECLALADGLRGTLIMLCKHIALAKEDKEEYAKRMTTVREKLDKIKKKREEREENA